MEEGEIEALALSLPQDLAEHVLKDNVAFRDEIVRWDKEQEERKRQEALLAKQQEAEMTVTDPNNDIQVRFTILSFLFFNLSTLLIRPFFHLCTQVVQIKLTHVHTHAKLSINITYHVIKAVEPIVKSASAHKAVQMGFSRAMQMYQARIQLHNEKTDQATVQLWPPQQQGHHHIQEKEDVRLESFIIYLIQNRVKDGALLELALLEQFSLPGLETNEEECAVEFRKTSERLLKDRRKQHPQEFTALRDWHQVYHWFRRSVHFFMTGLGNYLQHKFEESLDQFTATFRFTQKLADILPEVRP